MQHRPRRSGEKHTRSHGKQRQVEKRMVKKRYPCACGQLSETIHSRFSGILVTQFRYLICYWHNHFNPLPGFTRIFTTSSSVWISWRRFPMAPQRRPHMWKTLRHRNGGSKGWFATKGTSPTELSPSSSSRCGSIDAASERKLSRQDLWTLARVFTCSMVIDLERTRGMDLW